MGWVAGRKKDEIEREREEKCIHTVNKSQEDMVRMDGRMGEREIEQNMTGRTLGR